MSEIDFISCFQCKWLGNDPIYQLPCARCINHSLYEPVPLNKYEKKEINHKWCNTCEYKVSEERCQGCAIRDEFGNLKDLSNYKEENMGTDNNQSGFYIKEMEKDAINPDHYKSETSLECIEAMEIIFGKDAVIDFCVCNAWKYIWRWKNKNGQEDLRKADWYLTRAHDMISGTDKRYDTIKGMMHYICNHRGKVVK